MGKDVEKEKWERDLQRIGKTEGPRGNPGGDGKDKEKDEEGKKSFARISEAQMRQEDLERDDGKSQLYGWEKRKCVGRVAFQV